MELLANPADLGARQIDFVDDRQNLEPVIDREIRIRESLRFDSLRCVDDKQRSFACRKASGDFIAEVHMAGRIDEIENVILAVFRVVIQPHGFGLDRDTALALEVHRVEDLCGHFTLCERAREFEQAVRKRGFAMIDMSDDRKISYMRECHNQRLIHSGRSRASIAAPIMPASGHNFDCTIRQSRNEQPKACSPAVALAVPSSISPDAMTPPPMTIISRFSKLIRLAHAIPRWRPVSANTSRAVTSPRAAAS